MTVKLGDVVVFYPSSGTYDDGRICHDIRYLAMGVVSYINREKGWIGVSSPHLGSNAKPSTGYGMSLADYERLLEINGTGSQSG